MTSLITLPYAFNWRPYQLEVAKQFFVKKKKRFINVWHRRAGKDKTWFNIMLAAAMQRVGNYAYYLPEATQARRVIWNAIDKDGKRFLDHIPSYLLEAEPNQTEMLLRLINGSTIQLLGADRYDASRGSNLAGAVFSEYAFGHPLAWEYVRPIIRQNDGWAAFIYTPNGENHGHQLYNINKDNKRWYVNLLTVNDTKQINGDPVTPSEDIEEERLSGMSQEDIDQEYYCSFSSSVKGAYFGDEFRAIEKNGQMYDFIINTSIPVHTAWDLGHNDSTVIWFYQIERDGKVNIINYYENCGKSLKHYVNILHEFREKYKIVLGQHFYPHDGAHKHFGTKSPQQIAADLGLIVNIIPRTSNIMTDITFVRECFYRFYFHKTNCNIGILALKNYHKKYDDIRKTYLDNPEHDWSSHAADGLRCLCRALQFTGNINARCGKSNIGYI